MRRSVQLNRRLTLETPQRQPDSAGGYQETWIAAGHIWAQVAARTGRETAGGGAVLSTTAYRITVRSAPFGAPSRPTPNQRFRDGDRLFRIVSVADRDTDARFLVCYCEEEVVV